MNHRLKVIAITGCTLFSLVMAAEITYQVSELMLPEPTSPTERLFFQPLGDFPSPIVADLQDYFEKRFEPTRGLQITVLPTQPVPSSVTDSGRGALAVEPLLAFMRGTNPRIALDDRAVIIGLSREDLYSRQSGYVWAWRDRQCAVVSSAMFGPIVGGSAASDLARARLRKMVAKNVAILYYHKRSTDDPQSVLYHWLQSVPDIDRAAEKF